MNIFLGEPKKRIGDLTAFLALSICLSTVFSTSLGRSFILTSVLLTFWTVFSFSMFVMSFMTSLALLVNSLFFYEQFLRQTYALQAEVVWLICLFLTFCSGILLRSSGSSALHQNATAATPSLLLLTLLVRGSRQWDATGSFAALLGNGEDNAAWLVALAQSQTDSGVVLSPASAISGGIGTGVMSVMGRAFFAFFQPGYFETNVDNALALMRLYVFLAVLGTCAVTTYVQIVLSQRQLMTASIVSVIAIFVNLGFSFGLASVGHFSALCAILFLFGALVASVGWSRSEKRQSGLGWSLCVSSVFSAAQTWIPLMFLAAVVVFLAVMAMLDRQLSMSILFRRNKILQFSKPKFAVVLAAIIPIGVAFAITLAPYFSSIVSLDRVKHSLSIPGGYSRVAPFVLMSILVGLMLPLIFGTTASRKGRPLFERALFISLVLMVILSLIFPPYRPIYGAMKFTYVLASVGAVILIVRVGMIGRGALAVVLVLAWSSAVEPMKSVTWVNDVSTRLKQPTYPFVPVVVRELRQNPDRVVACLNSYQGDTYWNYITYVCSRMAMGLGGFNDLPHRVWQAMNFCNTTLEQANQEINQDFSQSLTVIVSDPRRLTSWAGCQSPELGYPYGWLGNVDWSVVRQLSPSGKLLDLSWTNVPSWQDDQDAPLLNPPRKGWGSE